MTTTIQCRECEADVSPNARSCPHCGAPFPGNPDWKGWGYEWKSPATYLGYPLIHIAFGRNASGKLRVAKGVIAIGQFAIGAVTIAQFGVGLLFGLGQFMLGLTAIAQFAVAFYFAIGQFAAAYIAIGQFALGYYALAQIGYAHHLWTGSHRDPAAVELFTRLAEKIGIHLRT